LINDLNDYGYVTLSNYSSTIDTSFFTGGGWLYNDGWSSGVGYAFASYSVANGSSEYLTQFSFAEIITQSHSYNGLDIWHSGLQMNYYDGMIVKYTPSDGKLTVLYYDWGTAIYSAEITINRLSSSAFFINRSVGRSYETSGSIVRAALVIVPYASTIAEVFDHVQEMNQNVNSPPEIFPDTFSGQTQLYGANNIIRGIYATTSASNRLTTSGHYINVEGNFRYNTSTTTSLEYRYRYLSSSSI
jgi:cephalosporin hydroxylase